MDTRHELVEYSLAALKKAGASEAAVSYTDKVMDELTLEAGKLSLYRTTHNTTMLLNGHVGKRKANISLNQVEPSTIDKAAEEVVAMANMSPDDEGNAIAEYRPPLYKEFGPLTADVDKMYSRMSELIAHIKQNHPRMILEQAVMKHSCQHSYFGNSNGVQSLEVYGGYSFFDVFTSKEDGKSSSFNFTGLSMVDLDTPLIELGDMKRLHEESGEQTHPETLSGSFAGDLIITPDCLDTFLSAIARHLSALPLIDGTSMFMNKLNQPVASPLFTLHSQPCSGELAVRDFITMDGYEAANNTVFDKGVLTSYLLSLYGSRKTGLPRAANTGYFWVMEPGQTSLKQMISGVKRGLLLNRFSGGHPSSSGDFSGVAKNSYLIEDGKVTKPLAETMISGNLAQMLVDITAVSSELVNNGGSILPWVMAKGITISGK